MDGLWIVVSLVVGLVAGAGLMLAAFRAQNRAREDTNRETAEELTKAREEIMSVREGRAALEATLKAERAAIAEQSENFDRRIRETFAELSSEALDKSSRRFLALAEENLAKFNQQAKGDLEKRQQAIGELVKPIEERLKSFDENIKEIESKRVGAYEQLKEQVKGMQDGQARLQTETGNLIRALRNPQQRGRWGEMQLETILKHAGLEEGIHFRRQQHRANEDVTIRPDIVVLLPTGREVVIDSKVPLEAYLDAQEAADDDTRAAKLADHARHVKSHVDSLSKKSYFDRFESAEFVILFLPGESLFSTALQQDANLLEYGIGKRVYLASPMTLVSMLSAIAMGWRQEQLAENAKMISEAAKELYSRLNVVGGHFSKLGARLDSAVAAFNDTVTSMDSRLVQQARRMKELQVSKEDVAMPVAIDRSTRHLQSPEFQMLPSASALAESIEPPRSDLFEELAESPASGA